MNMIKKKKKHILKFVEDSIRKNEALFQTLFLWIKIRKKFLKCKEVNPMKFNIYNIMELSINDFKNKIWVNLEK